MTEENKTKKSKKNKIKTQEEDSHDYKFDNTASLWNQLRIAWIEYHHIKKVQKPQISENQKTSSDKQLLGIETLIDNLLSELKLPARNNIKQLFHSPTLSASSRVSRVLTCSCLTISVSF